MNESMHGNVKLWEIELNVSRQFPLLIGDF
uniref:Uncharacterized protein n=1 Tax=Anguilla anguilla TaxID=7936 RepID=A0A0E9VLC3_ANGAN